MAVAAVGLGALTALAIPTTAQAAAPNVCEGPITWGIGGQMGHGKCYNAVDIKVKVMCTRGGSAVFRESPNWREGYNKYECASGWVVQGIWILVKQ
jgi:hypothetical protein